MKKILAFVLISSFTTAYAQEETIFQQEMKIAVGISKKETALKIAKSFIGKPYVAATLEGASKEDLVCNLHEFDCFTFVENVVVLTLVKHSLSISYDNYQKILTNLRYRNGKINGYGSREHYFIDWLKQAEKNGILDDVTEKIGGQQLFKQLNFMSSHRNLYPKLSDEKAFQEVKSAENNLNRMKFYFIPKSKLANFENKIEDGDIIGITSNVDGLDCNHEGFAIRQNNKIYLLHASLEQKKVVVSTELLTDYLARIKKHSGIMVARLK